MFTLGSNWATAALSPLKSTLKKDLHINNAQYGIIASANALVNTVLPVIGGIAIDWFGPEWGSILSSVSVLLGTLVSGIGASRSSYRTLVAGNVIFGLGSNIIESCQSKLYTHWFYGKKLGLVYGIDIAFGRVINTIAKATSIPIAEGTGWWGWSIWIPCIMAGVTLVINIGYLFFACRLPKESQVVTGRAAAMRTAAADQKPVKRISLNALWSIPAAFWIITISQLLQSGDVSAYSSITADLIAETRGSSRLVAGYTSSISQIIPIFVTPCVGALFDRYGRRMCYVSGTAALWILVYSLMGFTLVHPMSYTGISRPQLQRHPVHRCHSTSRPITSIFRNGFWSVESLQQRGGRNHGRLNRRYTRQNSDRDAYALLIIIFSNFVSEMCSRYNNVMYFLIALKSLDVVYGMLYHVLDGRYFGGVLRMSEAEKLRDVQLQEAEGSKRQYPLKRPVKQWTVLGFAVMFALTVTAWVLYLVYAQGS
ncbi:major facilitator superfamily domain-containing protein [Mycena epipterygia]|nr:major facilitator superfamily domain-containing protein [Mycena epipterygia]